MQRAALAPDALTLALPSFPAPRDMVAWQRQQLRQRQASALAEESILQHRQRMKQLLPLVVGGGAAVPGGASRLASAGSSALPTAASGQLPHSLPGLAGGGGECGAVRCHLLVEGRDEEEGVDESPPAAAVPAAGGAGLQPSGGSSSSNAGLCLSLVVSSCTARGTVKQASGAAAR